MTDTDSCGCMMDVLNCVNSLSSDIFTVADIYQFEAELKDKHPKTIISGPKSDSSCKFCGTTVSFSFWAMAIMSESSNSERQYMKTFTILIEETIVQAFEVCADDAEAALEIAQQNYKDGVFVLAPGEAQVAQMRISEPANQVTEWVEL